MSETTALGLSARTGAVMVGFTVIFTAVMAYTYEATKTQIAASASEEKMKLLTEVLPASAYDNALLDDYVQLGPTGELGLDDGGRIYRARKAGQPVALLIESVAPDGYSGRIELIVAVRADGSLSGVRAVAHRETPGLGDYIDPKKDKNKKSPWITQFGELKAADIPGCKVKKDGGQITYHTGATISARAVTNAVARAARYATEHQDRLFAAKSGGPL
ncbi:MULTISPECIES: electron transport complex subunit RsxG [Zoogloea]|jgi:electron transport complex protein RnfG|uniref:Ion-translocating oxidoreductase complex subunit G n=1 Tax=Zoogloea oleivorans TaxID=1552750 RepID=A0A6C2CNE4_9RHOO|nr:MULTISPECIES: electron transport complex subunit RsxG [Zoogloea]MBT9498318.1 electron transport complex subunit RsxG [Zoogloea sp.]MDD2668029.1 electron transport complex subunit RsxG [Zoogloea sp.]MDY0037671.1 electron transport complex subunit RsxG [Zoogloea oleivorans]TYC54892.1 electron transport complex subunit RsxG [Zoogloea oleivorans]